MKSTAYFPTTNGEHTALLNAQIGFSQENSSQNFPQETFEQFLPISNALSFQRSQAGCARFLPFGQPVPGFERAKPHTLHSLDC
jgi:hypothetical protein